MPSWTTEQNRAITDRGGTLLISAAAGSGKTAVLAERVVRRLTDPVSPTDADRLLVVTFTNAAAGELRERVSQKLSALADDPAFAPLVRRQLVLLDRANISTIDAFCIRLVRENFAMLGISPDFSIADENEIAVLQMQTLREVMDERYARSDASFAALSELVNNFRDDLGLISVVLSVYRFSRSHPFYRDWLCDQPRRYETEAADVTRSRWAQVLYGSAGEALAQARAAVREILTEIAGDPLLEKVYLADAQAILASVERAQACCDACDFDGMASWCRYVSFSPLRKPSKHEDKEQLARIKARRDEVKEIFEMLQALFCADREEFEDDLRDLLPRVRELFGLAVDFADRLAQKKAEKNIADFADAEQWTLDLLLQKEGDGYVRTPFAERLCLDFDEILIDECQDSNAIQDMIFSAVSKNDGNLFLVGDVKQSIYRFRQASPERFIEKMNRFSDFDGAHYPAKITLNKNFRSRNTVTDTVNFFFDQLMSPATGGVDYTKERLICGASYPPDPAFEPEFVLLGRETGETSAEVQARYIASRIRELAGSLDITEKDGSVRKAQYRDFCILLRSLKNTSDVYTAALKKAGIPCCEQSSEGFFSQPEISSVLSLLRVTDNPTSDMDMLTVMYADFSDFSTDDLARLRLCDRRVSLYAAAVRYAESGDEEDLREKCRRLLSLIADLRAFAAGHGLSELLSFLDEKLRLSELFSLRYRDGEKAAHIDRLKAFAAQSESRDLPTLTAFLRRIDRMIEDGADFKLTAVPSETNAVSVMSIHRSKGLEFPVCFLASLDKRFNRTDLQQRVLLHADLGFACVRRDERRHIEFPTVPLTATRLKSEDAMLSEEMRMLYVAMTRAREKMILVAADRDPMRLIDKTAAKILTDERVLPAYTVKNCKSYLEWTLLCALRHPSLRAFANGRISPAAGLSSEVPLHFSVLSAEEVTDAAKRTAVIPTVGDTDDLLARVQKSRACVYPYEEDTRIPTKAAVSQLTEDAPISLLPPSFSDELSPAERGTALHAFMQFADYAAARRDFSAELSRLRDARFLTEKQADAADPALIGAFFSSPLADELFSADRVWREYRFMTAVPACELLNGFSSDEPVMVQGIADCIFTKDGRYVILDYKSDRVHDLQQLADRYGGQLALYRRAVSEAFRVPEKDIRCKIWSFMLKDAIEV